MPYIAGFTRERREALCEYVIASPAPPVRCQVRALLLCIWDVMDTYCQPRDLHAMKDHIRGVPSLLGDDGAS